jgi:hypothetical protein
MRFVYSLLQGGGTTKNITFGLSSHTVVSYSRKGKSPTSQLLKESTGVACTIQVAHSPENRVTLFCWHEVLVNRHVKTNT